jgi:hypothetical protein
MYKLLETDAVSFKRQVLTAHGGTRWRSWLRHCATSRKVADWIPDGVSEIFHWFNPSGRNVALGSTQPLKEMSARNIFWGDKGGRCVGLTTLPPSCADFLEIWEPQPPGTLRACPGVFFFTNCPYDPASSTRADRALYRIVWFTV